MQKAAGFSGRKGVLQMMNRKQPQESHPFRKIRKRRFAGSLILLFLVILVFGLMISSAGGFFAAPSAIWRKKLLFLALFSVLVIASAFLGDALCEKLSAGHAFGLKLLSWLLFAAAPAFFFVLSQLLLGVDFSVTEAYLRKNLLLVYWLFLILCVICRRVSLAGTICGTVLVLLSLTEYYVYLFRGQGFTLLDLASAGTAMEVAGGYHFEMKPRMCALLLLFLFFHTVWRSFQGLEFGKRKLSHIGIRAGILAAMACVTFLNRGFALDSENVYLWNVNQDYTEKGYVYTLARELHYLKPEKPDGYSVEIVETIAAGIGAEPAADSAGAETYLSLEKESDRAFAELISYFEKAEEPTMIVLFGDHWPQLEEGFFTQLFGKDSESLNLTEVQTRYTTPYLIWTNYEVSGGSSASADYEASEEMSANYFGAYLTSYAGLSLTEYQQFLLKLKEEIPVIGASAVQTADGQWISMDSLGDDLSEKLTEYKILQYNNVFDRKNRIDSIFSLE